MTGVNPCLFILVGGGKAQTLSPYSESSILCLCMKTIRAKQVKLHIIANFALHDQYGIIAKKLNLTQTTILM